MFLLKKIEIVVVFLVLSLAITACSTSTENSYENIEPTHFSDGSYCYYSGNHLNYSLNSIPFDMTIENKTIPFSKVSFFELHENHSYTAYIVASLDRNNLSDDDIYWLTKYDNKKFCKTLDLNLYVTSKDNSLDTEYLTFLGCIYDDDHVYFSYCSSSMRYSFLNSEFSCQFIYTPTGITADDTVYYYYDLIITPETYSNSIGSLSSGERSALVQSLTE